MKGDECMLYINIETGGFTSDINMAKIWVANGYHVEAMKRS
jgi:hypothetical protein